MQSQPHSQSIRDEFCECACRKICGEEFDERRRKLFRKSQGTKEFGRGEHENRVKHAHQEFLSAAGDRTQ